MIVDKLIKYIGYSFLLGGFCFHVYGDDSYTVNSNDALSKILQVKFPDYRIYGKKGLLKKVLSLNPQIKNKDVILKGQVISLPSLIDVESEVPLLSWAKVRKKEKPSNPIPDSKENKNAEVLAIASNDDKRERKIVHLPLREEWDLSFLYGGRFVSFSQTGALGNVELGQIYINDLKFRSEFFVGDWNAFLDFSTYKFGYETAAAKGEKSLSQIALGGGYKLFYADFSSEQILALRNNLGIIELLRENLVSVGAGLQKEIGLPSIKPVSIKLKTSLHYPLKLISPNPQVEVKNVKGFGVYAETLLDWELQKKDIYSLSVNWKNNVNYKKLSSEISWSSSHGKVDLTLLDYSTSLGITIKFE